MCEMSLEERLVNALIMQEMYDDPLVKFVQDRTRKGDYKALEGFDLWAQSSYDKKDLLREALEALTGGPNEFQFGKEG